MSTYHVIVPGTTTPVRVDDVAAIAETDNGSLWFYNEDDKLHTGFAGGDWLWFRKVDDLAKTTGLTYDEVLALPEGAVVSPDESGNQSRYQRQGSGAVQTHYHDGEARDKEYQYEMDFNWDFEWRLDYEGAAETFSVVTE